MVVLKIKHITKLKGGCNVVMKVSKEYLTEEYKEKQKNMIIKKGDKVILDTTVAIRNNPKRNKWVRKHANGRILTADYDEKYMFSETVYKLKEDTTNPNWLFTRQELILINKRRKEKSLFNWITNKKD